MKSLLLAMAFIFSVLKGFSQERVDFSKIELNKLSMDSLYRLDKLSLEKCIVKGMFPCDSVVCLFKKADLNYATKVLVKLPDSLLLNYPFLKEFAPPARLKRLNLSDSLRVDEPQPPKKLSRYVRG